MADLTFEAEELTRVTGFRVEDIGAASGGSVLSLTGGATDQTGIASFEFDGEDGIYDIILGTFDESDGSASFELTRSGTRLGRVALNQQLGSGLANSTTQVERTFISSLSVSNGDLFTLRGLENGGETARFDFIQFEQVGEQPSAARAQARDDDGPVYLGDDGTIVLEAESAEVRGGWRRTSVAGRTALLYRGENSFRPSEEQRLEYRFRPDQSGTYFISLHSARDNSLVEEFEADRGNDAFVGVRNAETGDVIQRSTKFPTFLGTSNLTYRWGTNFSERAVLSPGTVELQAGVEYEFLLTGRSRGYAVDRITLNNGRFFRDLDAPQSAVERAGAPPIARPTAQILEAEDADTISGDYRVERSSAASGNQVLGLTRNGNNERGRATFEFNGVAGTYDVLLGAFDESDGVSKFVVSVIDAESGRASRLSTLTMDADLGSRLANSRTAVVETAGTGVSLTDGDIISVIGVEGGNEPARFDFLQLNPSAI